MDETTLSGKIMTMKQDDFKLGNFKAVINKSRNFFMGFWFSFPSKCPLY